MEPFLTFRLVETVEEADALVQFLHAHQIPSEVENEAPILDAIIIGQPYGPKRRVKIPAEDFETANELLKRNVTVDLATVAPDYYLLQFSDKELISIVQHEDQWGAYDYKLALLLLNERGIELKEEAVATIQEQRLEQLAKPEEAAPKWIFLGYFLAAFSGVSCLLPIIYFIPIGFGGMVTGAVFAWGRKTLPNGQRAFAFASGTRNHGVRMLLLGAIMMPLWVYILIHFSMR